MYLGLFDTELLYINVHVGGIVYLQWLYEFGYMNVNFLLWKKRGNLVRTIMWYIKMIIPPRGRSRILEGGGGGGGGGGG